MKKPKSDDNESENISGKSIGGAALINFFAPDVALIRGRHLIEGGAYSNKYGISFNFVHRVKSEKLC